MTEDMATTKVELDVERHVLTATVKLSDGKQGHIFTRNKTKNDSKMFVYNCHLCGVPNLAGERCLQTHISGRKHQTKLTSPYIDAATFRAPLVRNRAQISMKIAPGEPVPPGFENEVKPISELQTKIDKCKDQPLVGLEYIMELNMGVGKEPSYNCVLCDKRGDPRTIMVHITSYNHRLKYLERHFQTVVRELAPYRFNKDAREIMPRVLQSICDAIEDTHGRLAPNVYENSSFLKNRMRYLQEVMNDKHFDETMGSTFVNVIDRKAIQDALSGKPLSAPEKKRDISPPQVSAPKRSKLETRAARNSLDSISSISDSSISSPRKQERDIIGTIDLRSLSRSLSPVDRSARKSPKPQILPTPKELALQSSEIANERYKWEKYRCMVELAIADLEKKLKEHEKSPENHPLYPDEWKKFWNRRYKELQAEKKDPSKHDFKPEWIIFWTKRMKELHLDDIEKKKKEIKTKLNLPENGKERTDELKKQYTMKIKINSTFDKEKTKKKTPPKEVKERSRSPRHRQSPKRRSPRYKSKSPRRRRSPRRQSPAHQRETRSRSRSADRDKRRPRRSHSPLDEIESRSHRSTSRVSYTRETEPRGYLIRDVPPEYYRHEPPREHFDEWGRPIYYPPPARAPYYYREAGPEPSYLRKVPHKSKPPQEEEPEEPLTVVSVLRLLTALEELLGSLGPKVIDLLSKALALEKVKANSSDDMLINEDTCVIFETIKEKLKGQLIAGVVEEIKVAAVKRAIKNVAAVIHLVSTKKPSEDDSSKASGSASVAPDAKVADPTVDKAAIAQKIATALIMQGKTDVTPDQLEELINVYMAMAQKSKESSAPPTAASFLQNTEREPSPEPTPPVKIERERSPTPEMFRNDDLPTEASTALESLTDSDLQTLLQNFKDLSTEEQQHLIAHLKKLESSQPQRVEKLRKFVNVDSVKSSTSSLNDKDRSSRSPQSEVTTHDKIMYPSRSLQLNKPVDRKLVKLYDDDDIISDEDEKDHYAKRIIDSEDEDDYSYDDVCRAASINVKQKQLEEDMKVVRETLQHERDGDVSNASKCSSGSTSTQNLNMSIADTQNLIANLMGSLQKNAQAAAIKTTSTIPVLSSTSRGNNSNALVAPAHDDLDIEPRNPSSSSSIPQNNVPFYQQQSTSYYNNNSNSNGQMNMTQLQQQHPPQQQHQQYPPYENNPNQMNNYYQSGGFNQQQQQTPMNFNPQMGYQQGNQYQGVGGYPPMNHQQHPQINRQQPQMRQNTNSNTNNMIPHQVLQQQQRQQNRFNQQQFNNNYY